MDKWRRRANVNEWKIIRWTLVVKENRNDGGMGNIKYMFPLSPDLVEANMWCMCYVYIYWTVIVDYKYFISRHKSIYTVDCHWVSYGVISDMQKLRATIPPWRATFLFLSHFFFFFPALQLHGCILHVVQIVFLSENKILKLFLFYFSFDLSKHHTFQTMFFLILFWFVRRHHVNIWNDLNYFWVWSADNVSRQQSDDVKFATVSALWVMTFSQTLRTQHTQAKK